MFAAILSATLSVVFQISILAVLLVALLVWSGRKFRNPTIIKMARISVGLLLGTFGVFHCKCPDTRRPGFCWLWMELENCVSTAQAIIFGAIIMGITLSLTPLMISAGVTSLVTLASPYILYLIYPATLYAVRRDCK